jgi:hypothetical protein
VTYDAALVARRGLGPDELRLAEPDFLAAVRWAFFAERGAADLDELRAAVAHEPPDALTKRERLEFIERRKRLRADLAEREAVLYPPDEAS